VNHRQADKKERKIVFYQREEREWNKVHQLYRIKKAKRWRIRENLWRSELMKGEDNDRSMPV